MKNILLIFTSIFLSTFSYSQDIIVKSNGITIECKITSEDSTNVFFDMIVKFETKSTFLAKDKIKTIKYHKDKIKSDSNK